MTLVVPRGIVPLYQLRLGWGVLRVGASVLFSSHEAVLMSELTHLASELLIQVLHGCAETAYVLAVVETLILVGIDEELILVVSISGGKID